MVDKPTPELLALLDLPREVKIRLIGAAAVYRSGSDSCNSLNLGGLSTHMLFMSLGDASRVNPLSELLAEASDKQLNGALEICANIIHYMKKHPTKKCPTCGQITSKTL